MRKSVVAFVMAVVLPAISTAEPISGLAAKKMLFSPKAFSVEVVEDSGLDDLSVKVVRALVEEPGFNKRLSYYGALAFSPAFIERIQVDGLNSEASGLAAYVDGYHSLKAASAAAMAICEKALRAGDAPCVIAIRVQPKRWKARKLSLSMSATAAMKVYRKGKGPKAMAVSTGTVAYAIAKGEGAAEAALESCNASAIKAGAADCEVLVAD